MCTFSLGSSSRNLCYFFSFQSLAFTVIPACFSSLFSSPSASPNLLNNSSLPLLIFCYFHFKKQQHTKPFTITKLESLSFSHHQAMLCFQSSFCFYADSRVIWFLICAVKPHEYFPFFFVSSLTAFLLSSSLLGFWPWTVHFFSSLRDLFSSQVLIFLSLSAFSFLKPSPPFLYLYLLPVFLLHGSTINWGHSHLHFKKPLPHALVLH